MKDLRTWRRRPARLGAALSLAALAGAACAGDGRLIVGNGAVLDLGAGRLELGCADALVNGRLEGRSGALAGIDNATLAGQVLAGQMQFDFSGVLAGGGAFDAGSSRVRSVDGCARAAGGLATAFALHDFSVVSANGRVFRFPAGAPTRVDGRLELAGSSTQLLALRSDVAGTVAYLALAPSGTQDLHHLDVQDVGAAPGSQFLAAGDAADYASIDRGNSPSFFTDGFAALASIRIPALAPSMLLLLALIVSWIAHRRVGGRGPTGEMQ